MPKTLTSPPTINSLKSLMEEEGIVILPTRKYELIIRRLEEQELRIKRIHEEREVDKIIAEGEREFAEGKTIVASSSREALKKYHVPLAH